MFQVYSGCHKYVREFTCRAQFTPCPLEEEPIGGYPCWELCYEVHQYCPEVILNQKEFNTCEFYPSKHEYPSCYWPEVTCKQPEVPSRGSVQVTGLTSGNAARYYCDLWFSLEGDEIRICEVCTNQIEYNSRIHVNLWPFKKIYYLPLSYVYEV